MGNGFRELEIEQHYTSDVSDMLDEFYLPVLARASTYDRAAGFFSSAIFMALEVSLTEFLDSGGTIRMICSPHLSEEDAKAIEDGYERSAIARSLSNELHEWDRSVGSNAPSSLVRHLVAGAASTSESGCLKPDSGSSTTSSGSSPMPWEIRLCSPEV